MEYVNSTTSKRVDLTTLTNDEQQFYLQAKKRFDENTDWLGFDEFAFAPRSLVYNGLDAMKSPLYLAIKDMSLQLGVQQGKITRKAEIPHGQ